MSKPQVVAGFDIGTSALKVAVAEADSGRVILTRSQAYDSSAELAPGVTPLAVYEQALLGELGWLNDNYQLLAMALTTQMYSLCRRQEDLLLAYQWNSLWPRDRQVETEYHDQLIRSGCRPDTLYPAYKLASLPPQERCQWLPYGLKEHLLRLVSGELCTDYSTACGSGLFDAQQRCWNLDFVAQLGLEAAQLPRALRHDEAAGWLRPQLSAGPSVRTVVVPGLGDGPAASLACREVSNFCGNLGTSMAARVLTEQPDFSDDHGLWNYAVDDRLYAVGGISSNSCTVLHWAERLGLPLTAAAADPGQVRFFPWLHGERMPFWSSDLRGSVTGLSVNDGPHVLAAAVLRSIAFTFVRMALTLEPLAAAGKPLVLAGGGTNVELLLEIIAGCLPREIALLEDAAYLGSIGAAVSAGAAVGVQVRPQLALGRTLHPSFRFVDEYRQWCAEAQAVAGIYHGSCSGNSIPERQ